MSQNLIKNSTFIDTDSDGTPNNYTKVGSGTLSIVSGGFLNDIVGNSLKIAQSTDETGAKITIDVKPNTEYTFSFFKKGNKDGKLKYKIVEYNESVELSTVKEVTISFAKSDNRYSKTFTTGKTTNKVLLYFSTLSGTGDTIEIQSLQFEVEDLTEYSPYGGSKEVENLVLGGYTPDFPAFKVNGTQVNASASELNQLDVDAAPIVSGKGIIRIAKATYDVSGGDSGAEGSFDTGVTVPDNAIVLGGMVDVLTTFQGDSGNDDAMTLAIQVEGADDIVAAVAISDGSNPWDAGLQDVLPDDTAANCVKTTAAKNITVVVDDPDGTNSITAGKMNIFLYYTQSD